MDISIIGVPLKYGCDRDGVQFGPDRLRELGIINLIASSNHTVYDMGNIFVPNILEEDKYKYNKKMKYLTPIRDVTANLAHMVYSSLKADSFPLIIGGDHSLGMGSIAGSSKAFQDMAVVWVDAHGDINDSESSPSGNIHGMPLAASVGVGHPYLRSLYFEGQKVKPENVYIIGARDLDPGEVKLAQELNINLYTMDIIRKDGLENILNQVIKGIHKSQVDGVHLSFDIDALDISLVPGTGTPVKEGFTLDESKYVLEKILQEDFITSMDFVEFNPKLDDENKTTEKTCIELLDCIGKNL